MDTKLLEKYIIYAFLFVMVIWIAYILINIRYYVRYMKYKYAQYQLEKTFQDVVENKTQ